MFADHPVAGVGVGFSVAIADIVGPTTFDIDATELIWEFFQRFSSPAPDGGPSDSGSSDG